MVLLAFLAIIVVFGLISGAVASSRGHGFLPFFFLGALISPLLAIILVFVIQPPAQGGRRSRFKKKRLVRTRGPRPAGDRNNPFSTPSATYSRARRR